MKTVFALTAAVILGLSLPSHSSAAEPEKRAVEASADDKEAKYTKDIENRADDILAVLKLSDAKKSAAVREAVIGQYRSLRKWHDENDAKLKELGKKPKGADVDRETAGVKESLKKVHEEFISKLSSDLNEEQVEQVKDKMTYNVVQVTYNAFCKMLPEMTDDQKAHVLKTLKEAREEAMDGGSANEKHAIFGKYKGRINNYLSAQGYDLKAASKRLAGGQGGAAKATGK